MAQTNMTTGVSNTSSIKVTWLEDSLGVYTKVQLKGIKFEALHTVLLQLQNDLRAERLLDYMVSIAAKEFAFDPHIDKRELNRRFVELRSFILRLPKLRENQLIADAFKDAFKLGFGKCIKSYYKKCHKSQRERVNHDVDELFCFDVKQGTIVKL